MAGNFYKSHTIDIHYFQKALYLKEQTIGNNTNNGIKLSIIKTIVIIFETFLLFMIGFFLTILIYLSFLR